MTPYPAPPIEFDHALFTSAMKAYDQAFHLLPQIPSDGTCDVLATRIMALAATGERDPIKLRNHALSGMVQSMA